MCDDQKAKVDASILEFDKKKIRLSQLEFEVSMFKDTLRECKKGVGLCCTHNPYFVILVAN
jgi:hypothetical protein